MERLAVALVILVVAAVVAALVRRRRPALMLTAPAGIPEQVDRADFARPESPWLYVLFSSAACESCPGAAEAVQQVGRRGPDVAVDEVEYATRRELHRRYRIDVVPLTLLADADGRVREHFVGRTSPEQLVRALDRARSASGH